MYTIKINHEYQVGDTVFYMEDNKIKSSKITGIFIDSFRAHLLGKCPGSPTDYISIHYWLDGTNSNLYDPVCFFKSKKDILKSL